MSTLAKPVLRNHCKRYGIKTIITGILIGLTSSCTYYFCFAKPRQKAYHEFLRTYDPEEHMKELEKYGLLTYKNHVAFQKD